MAMDICTPIELKEMLDSGEDILLLDVRGDDEHEIVHIEGSTLIPLHDLEDSVDKLEPYKGKEIVVYCHSGIRSAMAQQYLEDLGFTSVRNLHGGIDAYAVEAEPGLPRY
jgi:rhodanese-related sulfurtransferase